MDTAILQRIETQRRRVDPDPGQPMNDAAHETRRGQIAPMLRDAAHAAA
jgi:hypothetical protein